MFSTARRFSRGICLATLCLLAARAPADHLNMNDMLGVGYSTNPRLHHNDIKGSPSNWAASHSPTVQLFVLSPVLATAQVNATPVAPAVSTTEKKTTEAAENAKPTPQPRRRLKATDTMDARSLIDARASGVELGAKARAFLQKFASDIEARCVFAMAREKIEPVEGMTVRYIIEIATRNGAIAVKQVTSPSNVGTPEFFIKVVQSMSPLAQPDPELTKSFGEIVRVEVTLS